jgi:aspartate-semialdehyde dehydrogenase
MVQALKPLDDAYDLQRIDISTYQATSGAGKTAMEELVEQMQAFFAFKLDDVTPSKFPHRIALNAIPQLDSFTDNGYTKEELKMVKETRKILSDDSLAVTATCIRVPIPRAHSESVNIEFVGERPSVAAIQSALAAFPGVVVVDDREANVFPMPLYASGRDEVFVGRIREDISCPNAIDLFLSGDQILKGAALNGYQIAECLIERGLLGGKK